MTFVKWNWNCLTIARIIKANSIGKNLETASFFCFKLSIRICLALKRKSI